MRVWPRVRQNSRRSGQADGAWLPWGLLQSACSWLCSGAPIVALTYREIKDRDHALSHWPPAIPGHHSARHDGPLRGLHEISRGRGAAHLEDAGTRQSGWWHADRARYDLCGVSAARSHLRAGRCGHEPAHGGCRDTRIPPQAGSRRALRDERVHGGARARRGGTTQGQAGDDALDEP